LNLCLGQDSASQFILELGDPQGLRYVKSQIPNLVAKGDEGLHSRQNAMLGGRLEILLHQTIGKALKIPKGDSP